MALMQYKNERYWGQYADKHITKDISSGHITTTQEIDDWIFIPEAERYEAE
jgi:hypothetical protein